MVRGTIFDFLYSDNTGLPDTYNEEEIKAKAEEVINSGKYKLMANYADNFSQTDQNSTEFIWAIPFDHVQFKGFNMVMIFLVGLRRRG